MQRGGRPLHLIDRIAADECEPDAVRPQITGQARARGHHVSRSSENEIEHAVHHELARRPVITGIQGRAGAGGLVKAVRQEDLQGRSLIANSIVAGSMNDFVAGAEFFVTPALRPATIEMVKRYSKVICPGALTPTEVLTAWEAGADVVKVFPCGNVGGAKYIKALKGPFPQIEMIPTGGVNLETAGDFLKAGACAVAVGGELVDAKLLKEGKYDELTERARQYLAVIAKARAA